MGLGYTLLGTVVFKPLRPKVRVCTVESTRHVLSRAHVHRCQSKVVAFVGDPVSGIFLCFMHVNYFLTHLTCHPLEVFLRNLQCFLLTQQT